MRAYNSPEKFPDTRWTLVAQLDVPETEKDALEGLCKAYWAPVFTFLSRQFCHEEAKDLTQEFLMLMVDKRLFQRANRTEGRLRTWILSSLELFLANNHRYRTSWKRGGRHKTLPLDDDALFPLIKSLAGNDLTPADAFDKAWGTVLLQQTLHCLKNQYTSNGRGRLFDSLLPWLLHDSPRHGQEAAAVANGLSVLNFRVQLHRLRGRYRDELRRHIGETVSDSSEVQAEIDHLFSVFGKSV